MIALWWLKQINRSISDPLEDDKHVWEAPWLWPNASKTLHLFQESSCPNLHTSKLCNAAATALAHAMSSLQSLTWITNLTQNNTWHMWMLKRDTQKTASVRLLPDKFLSASPACLFFLKKSETDEAVANLLLQCQRQNMSEDILSPLRNWHEMWKEISFSMPQ